MRIIETNSDITYHNEKLDVFDIRTLNNNNFFDITEDKLEQFLVDNELFITNEYPVYTEDVFYQKEVVKLYKRDGSFYGYLIFD